LYSVLFSVSTEPFTAVTRILIALMVKLDGFRL